MKDFEVFVEQLSHRLNEPLPGRDAQILMAPKPIDESRFRANPNFPPKLGGVMVLLFERDNDFWIPLIKRPEYNGHHSGQVSFPGGKKEKSDIDLIETALRETEEEVGVARNEVELLGTLTELFIIASNFKVLPTVGFLQQPPEYTLEEKEVESILEVSLSQLKDQSQRGIETMQFGKYTIHSPYFDVDGHKVWGATAMMLSELLFVLEELGN
ncbi:NUDIX hydrolase [Roseivirga pacifica]|uniref:NUDIX hydrolase n=1 Tax=Roseivirga pacifica TaxID=1267423 RepID=UPI003BABA6D9